LDKILKALHLRLDSTSKSLTKNAVSQLIIKILFQHSNPINISTIEDDLKSILKTSIEKTRIEESLQKLLDNQEIKYEKKKYSVTRSNRRTLDKRYAESEERLERIVAKYFQPYNSDKEAVIEWFSDTTIEFFKSYSNEWISDLCFNKSQKLRTKKENIFKHIERRTKNNKNLDSSDHNNLVQNFIDCLLHKKDSDLDAHLWEYGTSAFAANLLQSSIGADPISINAFRDSKCVLDTNVLMNIGLEASEYHHAIKKLDSIFSELNIEPGYFHITEQEYTNTVANKNDEILRTASKFSYNVIKETDDHFIQSAVQRQCHLYEDFETFCQQILLPPKKLDEKQEISYFNDDKELDKAIEIAQNDEKKKIELNNIYKNVTGNDKREKALIHDVGLIAGIEFYRKNEKAFILSQEVSINKYSHTKPVIENLPLAIRLETLINMLAIDNGGTEVNPTDFSNLFADMIRFNLQPDKDTFQVADLAKLLDTELQIEQLPADEVINLANKLHHNRSVGMSDEDVSLALNRDFQDVKLKFVEDYDIAQNDLAFEKSENQKYKRSLTKTERALRNRIESEELKKYENSVLWSRAIWFFIVPIAITILTCVGIYYFQDNSSQSNFKNYAIGIAINIVIWIITSLIVTKPKLIKRNLSKKNEINGIVEERFRKEIQ
jgi:hypothetical protein